MKVISYAILESSLWSSYNCGEREREGGINVGFPCWGPYTGRIGRCVFPSYRDRGREEVLISKTDGGRTKPISRCSSPSTHLEKLVYS